MHAPRMMALALLALLASGCKDDGGSTTDGPVAGDGKITDGTVSDGAIRDGKAKADTKPDGPKKPARWENVSGSAPALIYHTATRLNDGRVLIVGGETRPSGSAVRSAAAWVYSPTSNTFTSAGTLGTARGEHSATLLASGKVLVAGGSDASATELSSVEIFDPAKPLASAWSAGPSMPGARAEHADVVLTDGRVLLVGGDGPSGELTSMAIYNPTSNTWTAPMTALNVARSYGTATVLKTGKVLITGGTDGTYYRSSIEIYDPSAGTATLSKASLSKGRLRHTATLLPSGKVLVAGGFCGFGCALPGDDLYDPGTDSATPVSHFGDVPSFHAATSLGDGSVLVVGGASAGGSTMTAMSTTVIFQTSGGGGWTSQPSMGTARFRHTATLLADGSVIIVGGVTQLGSLPYLGQAERFYP